jgi:hypothetical protein
MVMECVEPAPWEGDARYRLRVNVMGVESVPVQSWKAIVSGLSQPRISNTTPYGAAVVNAEEGWGRWCAIVGRCGGCLGRGQKEGLGWGLSG